MASKETFEHDGKTYTVRLPNSKERAEGERIYNRTYNSALKDGCPLEAEIMGMAREHGIWSDEKDQELSALSEELNQKAAVLDEGGIELDEAKEIALDMRKLRAKLMVLNFTLGELKGESANRKADDARINYFVSQCVLTEGGGKAFKSIDDFYLRQNEDLTQLATLYFSQVWYNYNEDTFSFPEESFLKEYGLDEEVAPPKKEKKPFLKNGKPVKPKKVEEASA